MNAGFACFSVFRGDDDDAVGRAGTVDGRCRGVFQHSDGLDVRRVQAGDGGLIDVVDVFQVFHCGDVGAVERNAVEHPKRLLRAVDRGRTANTQFQRRPGCTRRAHGGQSGDLSGEGLVDVFHSTHVLLGNADGRGGGSELAAVDFLIARHDHLAHVSGVGTQRNGVVVHAFAHGDGLRFVGNVGNFQCRHSCRRCQREREMSVEIGRRARDDVALCVDSGHRGSHQRLVVGVGIGHHARNHALGRHRQHK